jgi:diguanylate cyclase (GGDEF)-like protein/PAS domain S-box-containing protein
LQIRKIVLNIPDPVRSSAPTRKITRVLAWLTVIAYALIFLAGYGLFGAPLALLAMVPVVLIGWEWGLWPGLAAGLLSLPFNTLLFNLVGVPGWDAIFRSGSGIGALMLVVLGAAAGRAHVLAGKAARQIVAQRQAEEDLRKREEKSRAMYEGLPVGVYRTTPEGQILDANPALVQLLGYSSKEDLQAASVQEIFVDLDERQRWQAAAAERGTIHGFEAQFRRADGSLVWVEDNAHILQDEHGRILYEGSLIDVSERKRVEAELRQSEAKYRNLLDHIPQKVFYKNKERVYVAVNQAYARDFNLAPEEIAGKTDFDINPPDLAEKYRSDDQRVLATGIPDEFDESHVVNGVVRTVHTLKTPVRDDRGEITGLLGIFWDITDRRRMEEAIRESEQRYHGLFEHSPISLWEEDFSQAKRTIDALKALGVTDFRRYFSEHPELVADCLAMVKVLDINQATLSLFHARSKEDLLTNLGEIVVGDKYVMFTEELIAIAEGKTQFEGDDLNRTVTGEILDIHLHWSVAPGHEDSLSKVFVSIEDITARRRAEAIINRQRAQSEALAETFDALSAAKLDNATINHIIVERTASLVGDTCVLNLILEDREWMEVTAFYSRALAAIPLLDSLLTSGPRPIGDGPVGRAITTRQPVLIPEINPEEMGALLNPGYEDYLEHFGIYSLLVIPLIAQGQVVGTLGVSRQDPGRDYTADDLAFLQNLGNHAALALMNASLHELVKQQARSDPLTGLYNRRYFFDLSEVEFARSRRHHHPIAMLMMDLDHFKNVNDTYGHLVGDQVLRSVAERCSATIRGTDLIGRLGGDEFAVLLPETELISAFSLAERIRKAVAELVVPTEGGEVRLTVSIGVAARTDSTCDLSELFQRADEALYKAKRSGRGQVAS